MEFIKHKKVKLIMRIFLSTGQNKKLEQTFTEKMDFYNINLLFQKKMPKKLL